MHSFDIKAILIACGTVSTNALAELRAENDLPILGVVEPACRRAVQLTKARRVGLIATAASVRSGAYAAAIHRMDDGIEVLSKACPLFVPLVENGRFRPGDTVVETVAREYLTPLKEAGIDVLILGCTHYPLLTDVISAVMGPEVALIDTGAEAAQELHRELTDTGALAEERCGTALYCVSDRPEDFGSLAGQFLQEEVPSVRQVDIERY
jgi:glutamate racemase